MNVRNALSRRSSVSLNARSRSRSTRRRNASNTTAARFKSGGATPDYDLREVVAQRFMNMNQAHDRIRMKLLAGR
jgi:hypothetical protein